MNMAIKFADFKYEVDPDYDSYPFIKTGDLVGKKINFIRAKHCVKAKDNSDYIKAVVEIDGVWFSTVLQGVALVNTIKNILNYYGGTITEEVQNTPVMIQTVKSDKGKDMYVFIDPE